MDIKINVLYTLENVPQRCIDTMKKALEAHRGKSRADDEDIEALMKLTSGC